VKVITSIAKMQEFSRQVAAAGLRVGLVPTMGYLHEGHLDLVRRARREADVVVVSIFVNPTQFDRREDFDKYPRNDERDRQMLTAERVDVLFAPSADDVYASGAASKVRVDGLTDGLCGPHRPGHFDGVTTIVASLFNMVLPHFAVFGEKDYQQLQVIRRMTSDLHFPVEIVAAPTVREADGLAMSSRNARLSDEERKTAVLLSRGLMHAASAFAAGERDAATLCALARQQIAGDGRMEIEYLELVDGRTLEPVATGDERSVLAAAVWLGGVRLIDNIVFARWLAEADGGPAETRRCEHDEPLKHTSPAMPAAATRNGVTTDA